MEVNDTYDLVSNLDMRLTDDIRKYIDQSVLCWLATASANLVPNVSPKEVFTYFGEEQVIIANIASPQTVRNIMENQEVCVSFIDIWVQKGYQLKGAARIVSKKDEMFPKMEAILMEMTKGLFPFGSVTAISIQSAKPIIAPRYTLYPETTEEQQIQLARQTYGA